MSMKIIIILFLCLSFYSCEQEEESPITEGDITSSPTGDSNNSSSVPSTPSGLSITYEFDFDETPTILVSGVTSGNTVKIYSNSDCSTEIGSSIASSSSTEVTVSSAITEGTYTFYATASNTSGSSDCSSANVTYNLVSCPSNYAKVPGSSKHNVKPFCVMKFEAKDVDS